MIRLPTSWSLPASLVSMELYGNNIQGWLPSYTWPQGLQSLLLQNNTIKGEIPQDWGLPSSLVSLRLDNNGLWGTLPSGWSLPSLSQLRLENNDLRGVAFWLGW